MVFPWFRQSDITFDNETAYGGILIRGLVEIGGAKIINGPFKVFEELFRDNESVDGNEINKVIIEQKPVLDKMTIVHDPRVGLRLLASEPDNKLKQEFLFQPYRFVALNGYSHNLRKNIWLGFTRQKF
jgi:hypothetical protein